MGASVACHLAHRGITDVVLLEREPLLATGSTGRNAGGVRHQFSNAANIQLSIESIAAARALRGRRRHADRFPPGRLPVPAVDAGQRRHVQAATSPCSAASASTCSGSTPRTRRALAPGLDTTGVIGATFCAARRGRRPNGVTMGFAKARASDRRRRSSARPKSPASALDAGRVTGVETRRGTSRRGRSSTPPGRRRKSIGAMAGVAVPVDPFPPPHLHRRSRAGPGTTMKRDACRNRSIMVIDFETTFYFHREGAGLLFGMGDPRRDAELRHHRAMGLPAEGDRGRDAAAARAGRRADVARVGGTLRDDAGSNPIIGPRDASTGFFPIAGFSGHGFQHSARRRQDPAEHVISGRDPGTDFSRPSRWSDSRWLDPAENDTSCEGVTRSNSPVTCGALKG